MKYTVIYSDPPWSYKDKATAGRRGVNFKYPTLSIGDIKNLPIEKIAADNSILFLWVTWPLLQEGLDTIKSWGFKYKTCGFVWIKKNKRSGTNFMGMGNYTRSNSELCLIGIRGKTTTLIKSHSVHQIIESPIELHSKKPDIVRDKIVELCGDVNRIELFSRQRIKGWDCIGNDIDGKDIREVFNTFPEN